MKKNYLKLSVLTFSSFLLSAGLNTAKAQLNFAPAVEYSTDFGPYSVVSADFNNDGKMDIATANSSSDNFSVLLNNGNGTYTTALNYPAANGPTSLCTADFNEDGNMDLAIGNEQNNLVSTHFGQGDGTFIYDDDYALDGGSPYGIVAADFNNDGHMDIVVTSSSGNIVVRFGTGFGGFSGPTSYPVALGPVKIFAADFNGDGLKDIVTANVDYFGVPDSVSVLLNVGAGTFTSAVNYGVSSSPNSVISADFNGDSKMDIATVNYNTDDVSVLLGNGNGTFTTAVNYVTDSQPTSLTFGDFNGDGKLDIATCNIDMNNVSILLGSGLGTFAAPVNFTLSSTPNSIIADDFNADGKIDIATTLYSTNNVAVLLNISLPPAGAALNFDGSNDYVNIPNNSSFNFGTNDFTIETWAKTTIVAGNKVMIGRISGPNNYWLGISNGNAIFSMIGGANAVGTSTIGDGNWHHIAAVRQNGVVSLYVDGVLEASQSNTGTATINANLTLGNFNGGFNFPGSLDEVRIWNRALCKGELVNNKNDELLLPQTGLVTYYKFNQGNDNSNNSIVTTLADSSGNAINGTLNGFALTGTTSNWIAPGAVTSGVTANEYIPLGFTGFSQIDVTCNGGNNGSYNLVTVGGTPAYSFAWSNGATTQSVTGLSAGGYTLNVTDAQMCKEILTINITEPAALDISTNTNNLTITANATGVNYQWIDCNNGNAAISGETNQSYTATTNGSYAVVITSGACSDTSACVAITTTGIKNSFGKAGVSIYPNPTSGMFTVAGFETGTRLEVVNVIGEVVYKSVTTDTKTKIDLSNQNNGVYFIKTSNGLSHKIVKQD